MFKKGDTVRRTTCRWNDMYVGMTDEVIYSDECSVCLKNFGTGHCPKSLELVYKPRIIDLLSEM